MGVARELLDRVAGKWGRREPGRASDRALDDVLAFLAQDAAYRVHDGAAYFGAFGGGDQDLGLKLRMSAVSEREVSERRQPRLASPAKPTNGNQETPLVTRALTLYNLTCG